METTTTPGVDYVSLATVEAHNTNGGKLSLAVTLPSGLSTRKYIVGGYRYYVISFGYWNPPTGPEAFVNVRKRSGNLETALREFRRTARPRGLTYGMAVLERSVNGTYKVIRTSVPLAGDDA